VAPIRNRTPEAEEDADDVKVVVGGIIFRLIVAAKANSAAEAKHNINAGTPNRRSEAYHQRGTAVERLPNLVGS